MSVVEQDRYAHLPRARAAFLADCAYRAVDDPARLAKAMRVVRAALALGVLTSDDLTPLPDPRSKNAVSW